MANIKNSLVDQLAAYEAAVKAANEAQALTTKLYSETDKSVRNLTDRTLTEFSLEHNVVMQFYFNSNGTYDPHFMIFHLVDEPVGRRFLTDNRYFVYVAGKWIYSKGGPNFTRFVRIADLDFQAPLKHVNLEHLAEACAILTEKTGCRVEHAKRDVVNDKGNKIPNNHADLLELHPGSRIAVSGVKGSDPWAIVQTRKTNYVVYYSTNGNGFGYDTVVMPEKSVSDFYYWLVDKELSKLQFFIPTNVLKRLDARGP